MFGSDYYIYMFSRDIIRRVLSPRPVPGPLLEIAHSYLPTSGSEAMRHNPTHLGVSPRNPRSTEHIYLLRDYRLTFGVVGTDLLPASNALVSFRASLVNTK